MHYSILGFNQAKLMETELDMTDLLLLNYVKEACGVPTMHHVVTEDGQSLVWLSHAKLTEDLPILRLSEGTLKNRIGKLRESGYLTSKQVASTSGRGSRTYYGITELTTSLIYDPELTTSLKNDLLTRPRHLKMTSDNLLTNDNKLKDISKDISGATPTDLTETPSVSEPSLSEYEQHMFSDDVRPKRKVVSQEKPKRLSLFQKCQMMIDDYGTELGFTDEVKDALREYLPVRLANKEKPLLGVNQWKGMLNKLATMSASDRVKIVNTSIERGYASFFAPTTYVRNGKIDPSTFGETTEHKVRKVTKEERENGYFTGEKF